MRALNICLTVHTLPEIMGRSAAFMSLQLLLQCVGLRSDLLTDALLAPAISLWQNERLRTYCQPAGPAAPEDLDEAAAITAGDRAPPPTATSTVYVFANVISVPTMRQIYAQTCTNAAHLSAALSALERLLRALLAAGLLTLPGLNEQTVRLLRWSWPDERFLGAVSAMLQRIGDDGNGGEPAGEFLGMLADLTRDLENLGD